MPSDDEHPATLAGDGSQAHALEVVAVQFDTLIEGAPLGIGLFDRQVRHVRVNPVLEQMNGLPAGELLGRTPAELHGAVGREAEVLYRQVMESGEPMREVALSGEIGSRPGELHHWSTSFYPVRHDGEVIGLCVIVADVTETRRLHDALAESEETSRRLAEHLQRSMLTELPRLEGLQLAAVYRPAAHGHEVGGDWYDAFTLQDGATAVVIGDVTGHDATATATMGAVRNLLRGIAWDRLALPSEVLRRTDDAIAGLGMDAITTVVYARIEQIEQDGPARVCRLTWSNAGHPPPLLVHPDGAVQVLREQPELLLGVDPEAARTDHTVPFPVGSTVVLCTDGLVERRGEHLTAGIERLAGVLAELASGPLEDLVHEVVHRLVGAAAEDDAAVLAVRRTG